MALQSSAEQPQPLAVVVGAAKGWVERLGAIWAEGQIIELTRRSGKAIQFVTLRDKNADVSVKLTVSSVVLEGAGPLAEGQLVSAHIRPTLWAKTGSLMFECTDMRPTGEGRLLAHLEQTKRKLAAEGLFNNDLKKRLPVVPRVIGLVTGEKSAAERDVIENVRRRWPAAQFAVRYALVQGPSAAQQVAAAAAELDRIPEVDVIVIARGGGSLEDLLPFSDEGLVRAVFALATPVVSAIGHEPDAPLLDFVADARASTPTDAAKLIVPDALEESAALARTRATLLRAITSIVSTEQQRLTQFLDRPVMKDPSATIVRASERLDDVKGRLERAALAVVTVEQTNLEHTLARVRALSPASTLRRGYAIVTRDDGSTVTSIEPICEDDVIVVRLADGEIAAAVIDTEESELP